MTDAKLDLQTLNMRPFEGAQHEAFVLEGGQNAALLVHGFIGTPAEMRPTADDLHQRGWTAHAPLLAGFGKDLDQLASVRADDWINSVRQQLQTLRQRYQRVVLIGFSMGGAIALNVASQTPPDKLVLINPFTRLEGALWSLMPVFGLFMKDYKPFKLVKIDFKNPETRKNIAQFMPEADLDDPRIQQAVLNFSMPMSALLQLKRVGDSAYRLAPRIHTPTLVIQATRDKTVPPASTHALAQRLPRPEFVEVDAEHNFVKHELDKLALVLPKLASFVEGTGV